VDQSLKGYSVFVVDDECVISSTLAIILQNQGFDTKAFTDPLEALRAACSEPPDLLITDIMMPVMSGVELAIQVKMHCPSCKVLLFSGQSFTGTLLENARSNGLNFDFLAKPVHPSVLLDKIKEVIEGSGIIPSQSPPMFPSVCR
jgi:DNA-binding NtrC family response regulator